MIVHTQTYLILDTYPLGLYRELAHSVSDTHTQRADQCCVTCYGTCHVDFISHRNKILLDCKSTALHYNVFSFNSLPNTTTTALSLTNNLVLRARC